MDIKELKRLAEAATPGEWHAYGCIIKSACNNMMIYDEGGHGEQDAAFIAAANPAVVLELIAEIELLRASVELEKK